jgi:hypothetical protein
MVNKYGKKESLTEYYDSGVASYIFVSTTLSSGDNYCFEYVYNIDGTQKTYRNSGGISKGFDKPKQETNEAPEHYNNDKGSLYKVAEERGWNPYLFDIVKRLERSEKKGEFKSDLEKSKFVIDLWLNESNSISI